MTKLLYFQIKSKEQGLLFCRIFLWYPQPFYLIYIQIGHSFRISTGWVHVFFLVFLTRKALRMGVVHT